MSQTHGGASSSSPITRAPSRPASSAAASPRVAPGAKQRETLASKGAARRRPVAGGLTFPALLAHRLDLFRPAASALSSLTRHNGTLVLLSALAMLVLLIASSSLLRLLARSRREGWGG